VGHRLGGRLAHPVQRQHGARAKAQIVGEARMLRHMRELVRQEHDPGRIRQPLQQTDQAHPRAIVGGEFRVRIVADQHQTRRPLADQPGAERALGHEADARRDRPLRLGRERAAGGRQARARMIGDDPGAPPES
jgi:hypothetical protein